MTKARSLSSKYEEDQSFSKGTPMTLTTTTMLPEKRSDLLDLALDKLEEVEADDAYTVDMSRWHEPSTSHDICYVCLAGGIIAKVLMAPVSERFIPSSYDEKTWDSLIALNDLRAGSVTKAIGAFMENSELDRRITPYYLDPELFKAELRVLARDMREAGL